MSESKPGESLISVVSKKTNRQVEFTRNFGETLAQAAEMFGEDVVLSTFTAQAIIRAQSSARAVLDKDDSTPESSIAAGEAYTPGVIRRSGGKPKKSAYKALAAKVASGEITMEEIQEQLTEALQEAENV